MSLFQSLWPHGLECGVILAAFKLGRTSAPSCAYNDLYGMRSTQKGPNLNLVLGANATKIPLTEPLVQNRPQCMLHPLVATIGSSLYRWSEPGSQQPVTLGGPKSPHEHKDPPKHEVWKVLGPEDSILMLTWSLLSLALKRTQLSREALSLEC